MSKSFRVLAAAAVLASGLALTACATSPTQFADSANNVVQNVGTGANAAVGIVTSIAKALLAIGQPISQIISTVASTVHG